MAGEPVPGVRFGLHDVVEVTAGPHAGRRGTVALLVAVAPEPAYLVALRGARGEDHARVRQSGLRAVGA